MTNSLSSGATDVAENLISAIDALMLLNAESDLGIAVDDLKGLCAKVKSAREGFPFVLEEITSQHVDRLGSVLLGPVFTSQKYPWPMDEDGTPMAPLCQINTAQLPRQLDGVDGLVQVWLAESMDGRAGTFVRVIPSVEANEKLIAPVIEHDSGIDALLPDAAEWLTSFHSDVKPTKNEFISQEALKLGQPSADALADANWDEWIRLAEIYGDTYGDDVVMCMQITGFGQGRIYCDITEDQHQAVVHLGKLKTKLAKKSAEENKTLIALLSSTVDAYKSWVSFCGELEYPSLYGTFHQIQYDAAGCDEPFLCFESIGQREWGDGGNAQVFYGQEKGFTFNWSCT
jgi:hypothetical protein